VPFEKALEELKHRKEKALQMGGPEKAKRQHDQGKLTAQERSDLKRPRHLDRQLHFSYIQPNQERVLILLFRGGDMNVREMFNLQGKVAIVTGGGKGIGLKMAEGLAEMGANIVLCSRNVENCQKAAQDLAKSGVKALAMASTKSPRIFRMVIKTGEFDDWTFCQQLRITYRSRRRLSTPKARKKSWYECNRLPMPARLWRQILRQKAEDNIAWLRSRRNHLIMDGIATLQQRAALTRPCTSGAA
jgi:hypothetical protein